MKNFYCIFTLVFSFIFCNVLAQQNGQITGIPTIVHPTKTETTADIMERAKNFVSNKIERPEREYPDRRNLPQNPLAKPISTFPENNSIIPDNQPTNDLAQTPSTTFTGATLSVTGAFPPDNMGAVGPTQYVVFVNGRLRTFNKTTGVADGVLNADPDVFFASVMSPVGGSVVAVFTSDARVRYDRLSGKWILMIIDVPIDAGGGTPVANRVLIAFSNTSTITGATTWTFSQFTGEAGKFTDYETLGVDVNAIYIGTNMFSLAGSFTGTNGYVINRTTLLSGGAYTVYSFLGLASGAGAGPYTPQGVDNFDFSATEGYFIGVDNATFGTLMMRRVSTPAGVPTISANISITVSATAYPRTVPHLGNTGGTSGNLDALDDRLFAAMAIGGHLWTAHNIGVNTTGVATSTTSIRRNAARWYDLTNLTTTPTVSQSGTVFDGAVQASARDYFIPSIMVSGQNHAALSLTTAGTPFRSDAATVGRWSGDGAGTMQTPPTLTTASATAYNPPSDPGGGSGRRWGDYSYVSLDPLDNMTMWMINQFCDASNSYGCNVTKLLAPPPATPASCSPASTPAGQASVNVIVTGTVVNGSGFYDPGTDLSAPALPYTHISATVSGGVTVNSVTYTDPTHVTLNLNTVGSPSGAKNVTITNPDGQVLTGTGILTISGVVPITLKELRGKLNNDFTVSLNWITSTESGNKGFLVERSEGGNQPNWISIGFVPGVGYSTSEKSYSLIDNNIQLNKIYHYRLKQLDFDNNFSYSNEVVIRVKDLQKDQLLLSNHPNPFSGIQTIRYNLPAGGMVNLKIFDIAGKEVGTLVNGFQQSGLYSKEFNATGLSNGIYFCKLSVDGESITNRIMLIR